MADLDRHADPNERGDANRSPDPILLLKECEVAAKEREVAVKEREINPRWTSPLVIGLLAAGLGLVGNMAAVVLNSRATLDLERTKLEPS
jgi:hypothetical protein